MAISADLRRLARQVGDSLEIPAVRTLLLPPLHRDTGKMDEFGFIVLEDGSVGPFYVSLDETLLQLHLEHWRERIRGSETVALTTALGGANLTESALGVGALNALSQYLMRQAGFDATATAKPTQPETGERVGMVGYFPPLAERYRAQGVPLAVVEKNPSRVPDDPGIEISSRPGLLAGCRKVICTASTLVNGTLDEILAAISPGTDFSLTGPSAGCLPDPLFAAGVSSVGGIRIDRSDDLAEALASGASWSDCGRKYQLNAGDYPGIGHLLRAVRT